jgi:hypothetical protein
MLWLEGTRKWIPGVISRMLSGAFRYTKWPHLAENFTSCAHRPRGSWVTEGNFIFCGKWTYHIKSNVLFILDIISGLSFSLLSINDNSAGSKL